MQTIPGWRFSYRGFTLGGFPEELMRCWNIPEGHMAIKYDEGFARRDQGPFAEG